MEIPASFHELPVFIRGIILGILFAAPVGPAGLLCIRRTLSHGAVAGLATGFGAAFADSFFAGIAAFGVSAVVNWVIGFDHQIKFVGGIMLIGMAIATWFSKPHEPHVKNGSGTGAGSIIAAASSGCAITATNPVTVLAVLAVVTTFAGDLSNKQAAIFVAAIFVGAFAWWSLLSLVTALIRHKFAATTLRTINRCTAVMLVGFGLWVLASAIPTQNGSLLPGAL